MDVEIIFTTSSFCAVIYVFVVQTRGFRVELLTSFLHNKAQPDGYCQNDCQHRDADAKDDDDSVTIVVGVVFLHTDPIICHYKARNARLAFLSRVSVIRAGIARVAANVVLVSTGLYWYPLRT